MGMLCHIHLVIPGNYLFLIHAEKSLMLIYFTEKTELLEV